MMVGAVDTSPRLQPTVHREDTNGSKSSGCTSTSMSAWTRASRSPWTVRAGPLIANARTASAVATLAARACSSGAASWELSRASGSALTEREPFRLESTQELPHVGGDD